MKAEFTCMHSAREKLLLVFNKGAFSRIRCRVEGFGWWSTGRYVESVNRPAYVWSL